MRPRQLQTLTIWLAPLFSYQSCWIQMGSLDSITFYTYRLTNQGQIIDSFHRCGRLSRLVANLQGSYDNCAMCYMFLNIKLSERIATASHRCIHIKTGPNTLSQLFCHQNWCLLCFCFSLNMFSYIWKWTLILLLYFLTINWTVE